MLWKVIFRWLDSELKTPTTTSGMTTPPIRFSLWKLHRARVFSPKSNNHPSCRSSKSICETGNSSFLARCYSLTPTQINLRETHPQSQIPYRNSRNNGYTLPSSCYILVRRCLFNIKSTESSKREIHPYKKSSGDEPVELQRSSQQVDPGPHRDFAWFQGPGELWQASL